MSKQISFRYFKICPEITQLAVMLYVWFPLSLRNVEDLLHEWGVDVSYESVHDFFLVREEGLETREEFMALSD